LSDNEQEKAIQVLKKHSHDLLDIAITQDHKALERIAAEDVMIVDPHGKIFTRNEEVKLLKAGKFKATIAEMKMDHHQVKFYGKTAVVTGISHVKGSFEGKDMMGSYRFTQIFMDSGQGWLM